MSSERRFVADASSVPTVRRYVVNALGDLPPKLRNDVSLMVSELATNAVVHARTEFAVHVRRFEDGVRVDVIDVGAGTPKRRRRPTAKELHGRGLLIVEQLADRWGVSPAADGAGKDVWFELTVPSPDRLASA